MEDEPPCTMTGADVYAVLAATAYDQWLTTGRAMEICRAAHPQQPITSARFRALLGILRNRGHITSCTVQETARLYTRYWACPPPGTPPPPTPSRQEIPQWYLDILARRNEILDRLKKRGWSPPDTPTLAGRHTHHVNRSATESGA